VKTADLRLHAVLAGGLALEQHQGLLPFAEIWANCQPLLQAEPPCSSWAKTPWGLTLPRSCVGSSSEAYQASWQNRPRAPWAAMEEAFARPLAEWLETHFERPVQSLGLPSWALRVMPSGGEILPHCEDVWNPLNLVETGALGPVTFEPNFQLSYLYVLQAPSKGGELEIYNRQGAEANTHNIGQFSCKVLSPHPGELLMFNAGQHWHRIRPCQGPTPRVVLGGFIRLNRSHTALHLYV